MEPITIAASPLTYSEYKKLSLADLRTRHPYQYIGLPIFSIILLIITVPLIISEGVAAIGWETIGTLLFLPVVSAVILLATWLTLSRNYKQKSSIKNGQVCHLNEQGITFESNILQTVTWSDIARTAKQSGQWILLRQAAATSGKSYFLNTAGVMPPASRTELLALLKSKRIKPI